MKVLVVEDEEAILRVLTMILKLEGYQVEGVRNGAEALEWLAHQPAPDVILLDLMMPVMDGREFLRRKEADARLAAIPTFVLSAFQNVEDLPNIRGFLKKPLEVETLLLRLEECRIK